MKNSKTVGRVICCIIIITLIAGCNTDKKSSQDIPKTEGASKKEVSTEAATVPAHDEIDQDEIKSYAAEDVIVIKERLFVAQTNDIYLNAEEYLGKTIRYEGIFMIDYWEEIDEIYYYVFRYGPGCCGYDANAGFQVIWDGEYPAENDWVEAEGILESYEVDGEYYLQLQLTSLTVLEERGEEHVTT